MTLNLPPSRNPAINDSLAGTMRLVLTKWLQSTDDMLPAEVVAYDRATNVAQIQPLIVMVTTGNQRVARAQVASVPVLQLGGGGFVLSFPVASGDLGWIKANDRDISLFKKTLKGAAPNTQRLHDFADAMFIPDTMFRSVTVASEDSGSAVLQGLDGSVRIALAPDYLKIIAPAVGVGGRPNANAVLDLQSTAKAFIPPRMTTGQRDAIPPAEGMVIWNTDVHGLQTYNGTVWG